MDRQGFIGGTDAIRIMNGEWAELYQEKVGLVEPKDLTDVFAVQLGAFTEDFNLNWWVQSHSPGYTMAGTQRVLQHELKFEGGYVPFKGTADMMCVDNQKKSYIVEAKHTNAFTNMNEVIERYMPQIQLYMHLHNKHSEVHGYKPDGCYLSVIFGNSKWESKHVAFDQVYCANMLAKITQFWEHVIKKSPPIDRDAETPDISSIKIDRKVKLDMNRDNEWMSDAHDYVDTLESAKKNESAKKRLMSHIPPDVYQMDCDLLSVNITEKRRTIKVKEKA